jgi:DNA-binding NarL/FixJ family response regulator
MPNDKSTEKMIKLFITDDHKIIRDGIRSLLSDCPEINIVGEAGNGHQAIENVGALMPDVILMDISMPEMNGIETTRILKNKFPEIKILVLSMSSEEEHIRKMLEAGASGYILKNSGKEGLVKAVKSVYEGKHFFSDEVTDSILQIITHAHEPEKPESIHPELTEREKEILKLITSELTNPEIALKLFISVRTVDAHRRNILEKTGCRNTAGLVKYAFENKII